MSAEESLQEGNLEQALGELQDRIRNDPANAKLRVFLFQLLAVMGEWERALNQLNVLGDMDPKSLPSGAAIRGLTFMLLRLPAMRIPCGSQNS